MIKRVILIVLDSLGIGELPDAYLYGDAGSNTLKNIIKKRGYLNIDNMSKLGISNIEGIDYLPEEKNPAGFFGRCKEKSAGKDTTTGHWEIAGIIVDKPFPTYPEGFPNEIIETFIQQTGYKILGNKPASGTQIIEELGQEHIKTGYPIIYTSADSVFQIAAHEQVINIDELYNICSTARNILVGKHGVARVIARPFIGEPGSFIRTNRRKDFSLSPPSPTMLDFIKESDKKVVGVGKIEDIFNKKGITEAVHSKDNSDGIDKTIEYIKMNFEGLIFTNLVDFDMKYGHRNDVEGYARAIEEFDRKLPKIINNMNDDDILILTSDHGCDPTTDSTDHSREYSFLLGYGHKIKKGVDLKTRNTFSDIGQTICSLLGVKKLSVGESFANMILPSLKINQEDERNV